MRGSFKRKRARVSSIDLSNLRVVLEGIQRTKKDGTKVSFVKTMQLDGENVNTAEMSKEIAVSIPGVIVGRQIKENDILYLSKSG